ncbi:MAG: NAD(P)-dependent oxidoreductase [Methanobrevibacter sp.]|uniref:NAD(P)-dependent oxidoreductase n=1 Tax=Methanobrevibacter sp. TaxID=66852 RepID=UPI0025E21EE9|nr:NAD(P)-dependent oxidoreductase [Methanobrevibacter sp.]MBQ6099093.1 NAD(P)-dependent oxidoreductase [Methanobrevibacter sp.]
MIIGLIGFGKVSKNLFNLIKSDDIQFVTSFENRSSKTIEHIKKTDIEVFDSFKEVAVNSDILISATSPGSALDVAKNYGKYCDGIYLDLNNISPDTTFEIAGSVKNLVDGAIIGKIDSENPILYVAGKKSDDLQFLNEFITTKKISDNIGDAAILKLLRSSYTKTLSALLIESSEIARKNNLEDEFFEILALTEGDEFREKSISRINNTLDNSKRKSEELNQIIDYFDDEELIMVKAALKKLNR